MVATLSLLTFLMTVAVFTVWRMTSFFLTMLELEQVDRVSSNMEDLVTTARPCLAALTRVWILWVGRRRVKVYLLVSQVWVVSPTSPT